MGWGGAKAALLVFATGCCRPLGGSFPFFAPLEFFGSEAEAQLP